MARLPSIHAVSLAALVLTARIGAQQPTVSRAAAVQRQLVPSVVGLSRDSASRVLTSRKLAMRIETNPRGLASSAQDVVAQQSPAAGQPVPTDRTVAVVVTIEVIRVPDVTGLTVPPARERLARFTVREQPMPSAATTNTIFRQDPAPFTPTRPGATVTVYVAQAIQPIQRPVPNVVGRQLRDAGVILTRFGFRAGTITDDDDADVAAGVVVRQNPTGGQQADTGTRVGLTVRTNRVRVPAVLTLTEADARQQIAATGLRVAAVESREDAARVGTVIEQSPVARTPVERGSDVLLVVAREAPPAFVVVPNLIGRRIGDATRALDSAGLQLGMLRGVGDTSSGRVASQSPSSGSRVAPKTVVDLDTTIARAIVGLIVTPERAELRAGDTLRFTAIASMNDGTRSRARAAWTASAGGTIASDGLFTAGSDSGTFDVTATVAAGIATGTARVRVTAAGTTPPSPPIAVVPDIVGLSRAEARVVASRAGFALVVAPGQSARDADVVIAQTPLARTPVSGGSLVLMARFGPTPPPRPNWILWVALGIAVLVAAAVFFGRKAPTPTPNTTPPQVAPPPISYAARSTPPSFTITEGKPSRGLELSLSMQNDPGVQAVVETPNAP